MEPPRGCEEQVIGFVGSTGMSTGAHMHHDIIVSGRFIDALRIKLPHGRALEGALMAGFEKRATGWMA